ncbi:hypothetical protein DN069_02755 [Streptacidiphilus pinicola]|uniref:Uncharacterized protein n=1 Tax=Streptacidiphilus pinicola TaxID=2219663 RepID=A0A2X0IUW5_9ACTN|nr:hypothetical protein DN069_02755 [Streptacidiphilus pinicola]
MSAGGTASFVCAPGGDESEALVAVTVGAGDCIALAGTVEPVVITAAPMQKGLREQLWAGRRAAAVGRCGVGHVGVRAEAVRAEDSMRYVARLEYRER